MKARNVMIFGVSWQAGDSEIDRLETQEELMFLFEFEKGEWEPGMVIHALRRVRHADLREFKDRLNT